MLYAIRTGLALVVAIVVTQLLLPEIAVRLISLIVIILDLSINGLNQATTTLPY